MAKKEHVEMLKRNVWRWNEWRKQYPEIHPDLGGADLNSADLSDADLIAANLSRSNLSRADLSHAILQEADLSAAILSASNLSRSNLRDANLNAAILSDANLNAADLSGADLSGAILSGVNLSEAHLYKVDLSGVRIARTVFAWINLSEVKGLTELVHQSPSHVALHTIQLPQDGSALHFLRGCGVSDEWIDFYRSTMMHPIQYHSVFISYSSKDEQLARRLHADLQDKGVRCWFAPHALPIGAKTRPEVDRAIYLQEKLLLILSAASVVSDWVEHEVETALKKERKEKRTVLFPIRIDRAILDQPAYGWPELVRNERNIGDFSHWTDPQAYQQAFERLVRDLKKADE